MIDTDAIRNSRQMNLFYVLTYDEFMYILVPQYLCNDITTQFDVPIHNRFYWDNTDEMIQDDLNRFITEALFAMVVYCGIVYP